MSGDFEKRAAARDASLGVARTEAAKEEERLLQKDASDQQHLREQHAQDLGKHAEDHASRLDKLELAGVEREKMHVDSRRHNIAERQLNLAHDQLTLDEDTRNALGNLRDEQAAEAQRMETAFENWSDQKQTAQKDRELSNHRDHAGLADILHLQTAVNRSETLKSDALNHAERDARRQERWANREQEAEQDHERRILDHEAESLASHRELGRSADKRALDLAKKVIAADGHLQHTQTKATTEQAEAEKAEDLRHENRLTQTHAEKLDDSLSFERTRARDDHDRVLNREADDQGNDQRFKSRLDKINHWKMEQSRQEPTDHLDRTTDYLARTKSHVNSIENLRLSQAQEQEHRAEAVSQADRSRWNEHSSNQTQNAEHYSLKLDNAILDFAQESKEHRNAIVKLEDDYRLRRAAQDVNRIDEQSKTPVTRVDHLASFNKNLDDLNTEHPNDSLSAQRAIAGRNHDHVLGRAENDLRADEITQKKHSERNAKYSTIVTQTSVAQERVQDYLLLQNNRSDLAYQKDLGKQTHDNKRDTALSAEKLANDALMRASENAFLQQTHHDQQKWNRELRNTETDLIHVVNVIGDKVSVARAAHANQLIYAKNMQQIESRHRQNEEAITADYASHRAGITDSKAKLKEEGVLQDSTQLLDDRATVRKQDLTNHFNYALSSQELAMDEADHTRDLVNARASANKNNSIWYEQDISDKTQARNDYGRSLFTHHAKTFYDELRDQADAELKSEAAQREAASRNNREFAQDLSDNRLYETQVHDEAALALHQAAVENHRAKAIQTHDHLLDKASALLKNDHQVRQWEQNRLEAKSHELAQASYGRQEAKDEVALAKAQESLTNSRGDAQAVHEAMLTASHEHLIIDEASRERDNHSVERIAGNFEEHHQRYSELRAHQKLDSVSSDLDIAKLHAGQADGLVRKEKLSREQLLNAYENSVTRIKSDFTQSRRKRELNYLALQDNLISDRVAEALERKTERMNREALDKKLKQDILENEIKIKDKGYEGNSLVWWWNNGDAWLEQVGLRISNNLDSLKESWSNTRLVFSQNIRAGFYASGNARQEAGYYASRLGLLLGYYRDATAQWVSLGAQSLGDALVRTGLRAKAFVKENFIEFFSKLFFGAQYAGHAIDESLAPLVPDLRAGVAHAAVSAEYAGDRFSAGFAKPIRSFMASTKAYFKSKLYGFFDLVQSFVGHAKANMKLLVNSVAKSFSQFKLGFSDSLTRTVNAFKNGWRHFVYGAGHAQRTARHHVVLPGKQAVAGVQMGRKTGFDYLASRPAAWWRDFKHGLGTVSWQISAKTYPTRSAVAGLGDDTVRLIKYYTNTAQSSLSSGFKSIFSHLWFGSRAGINAASSAVDNVGLGIVDKAQRAQEITPNIIPALQSAALTLESAMASAKLPLSLTGNDLSAEAASLSEHLFHAGERPIRSLDEAGRTAVTATGNQLNQAGDGLYTSTEVIHDGLVRAGSTLSRTVKAADQTITHAKQTLGSGVDHLTAVSGQVFAKTITQPLRRGFVQGVIGTVKIVNGAGYAFDRSGQQVGESLSTIFSLPGQALQSASLSVASTADRLGPNFSYGLQRTGLSLTYYGEVAFDGMAYTVELIGDVLQAPIVFVSEGIEIASDAVVTKARQKGHAIALGYQGFSSSATQSVAGAGYLWTKTSDHFSYGLRKPLSAVGNTLNEAGSRFVESLERGAPIVTTHLGHFVNAAGNLVEDAGNLVVDSGKAVGVPTLALTGKAFSFSAYAATAVFNATSDSFSQKNQTRQYWQGQVINAVYYFGVNRNEGRTHAFAVAGNIISTISFGIIPHAVHLGKTSQANADYALSMTAIPMIQGRMIWNDLTHGIISLGYLGLFELVQKSDAALCAAIEGAIALKDETYYAFEGYGDRIILRMKGMQVSVMNGAGHYAVKSLMGLGSLSHRAVQLSDQAVNGVKAFSREHWNDARHLAIDVEASLGQAKDDLLDPIVKLGDKAYTGTLKMGESTRALGVGSAKEGVYQLKSNGLWLMSSVTRGFTGAQHAIEEKGRNAAASLSKKKDDIAEYVDDHLNIDNLPVKEVKAVI